MTDGGNRTERSELEVRIGSTGPVWAVVHPHRQSADKCTGELRQRIANDLAEVSPDDGESKRDRRIQVGIGAATGEGGENAGDDGERPARGDREPASVFTLRSFQQDAGDDAVAKQDQDRGSEKLSEHRVGTRPESIWCVRPQQGTGRSVVAAGSPLSTARFARWLAVEANH